MRVPRSLLPVLAVLIPAHLAAQSVTPYGVTPGARARIDVPSLAAEPFAGRVVALGGDSLVFAASSGLATVRIPLALLQRVDASDGRDRAGAALRYGGIGLVAGSVLGVVALRRERETNPLVGIAGAFAGAVLGAPIGAAIGALLAPERWRTVWTPAAGTQ